MNLRVFFIYICKTAHFGWLHIVKGKGVHRELESERSRRQTSDLTDRNFIQGI